MFQSNNKKTLYIIDGYGFIFRAFYAVPNLTSKTGEPIGAVYGFFKMLISLINSAKPEYMVVALDTGQRTFRNDLYDQFVENKAIEEFFKNDECKKHFTNINLTLEDVKNKETSELIELTGVNHDKLINLCNEYNIEILKPPKILVLLLFLELVDHIKVEDYKTQYKANRKETPQELKGQFKIIRELINSMNISHESSIGYEADDVIATLATEAVNNNFQVVVVSADKDLCQLVKNDAISIFDPAKKIYLDEQGVINKFGIKANQVCDYLSIVGDSCDNVFGVNGIGPKGAVKLLTKYGDIENLLLHLNELDDKTKQKFLASKDVLQLARQLVSLKYDAIQIDNFEKYKVNINHIGLAEFIDKYGFKSLDKQQRENGFGLHSRNQNKNHSQNNNEHHRLTNQEQNTNNTSNSPYTKQGGLF